eukprot:3931887-Rhodomonas_salina.1
MVPEGGHLCISSDVRIHILVCVYTHACRSASKLSARGTPRNPVQETAISAQFVPEMRDFVHRTHVQTHPRDARHRPLRAAARCATASPSDVALASATVHPRHRRGVVPEPPSCMHPAHRRTHKVPEHQVDARF